MKSVFKVILLLFMALGISQAATVGSCGDGQAACVANVSSAPVFSLASGVIAPGTTTAISCSTMGCVIFYTTDGSSPAYITALNGAAYPDPSTSTMEFRGSYIPNFPIYGTMNFKAVAHAAGFADSSVTGANYSLTAVTGTAVNTCRTIAASGTYYLTADLTCTANGVVFAANNINFNLNGHTVTYGTGDAMLASGSNIIIASGSSVLHAASGTPFSTCSIGDRIWIYDNTFNNLSATVSACTSSTQITISGSAPGFSANPGNFQLWNATAHHGLYCDDQFSGGDCDSLKLYNGIVTQSANSSPDSGAIHIGSVQNYGDNGSSVVSNIDINVSQEEVHAISINYGTYGNLVQFNYISDTSTVVWNRDQLYGYPIFLFTGNNISSTTNNLVHDNQIVNSPQGAIAAQESVYIVNNLEGPLGPTQYVAGYCNFVSTNNGATIGNNCWGNARGNEIEASNITVSYNISNTTDSSTVMDPNHNAPGCEAGGNYGTRVKDYSNSFNAIMNVTLSWNIIIVNTGGCSAQGMRWTQVGSTDSGTVDENIVDLNMATNVGTSSVNSIDQTDMTSWTMGSDNYYSKTGTYATSAYDIFIGYDGGVNWTIGVPLASPSIYNQATVVVTPASTPTGLIITGTGTATCTAPGGIASYNILFNGSGVTC